ncbi:hypothetical protein LIA77_05699 [Sarocladium implicatum]|nr:hypothetical protein LIA77_05699 [Sarocladium implicatum]
MGSFGDGIISLLDTYTRCLALLRGLSGGSKATRDQARLGTSIRTSRSNVRKFYSARVSERGSSFETATARSSLRRLVRRLRAFLDNLMGSLGLDHQRDLDYGSLVALSTGSGLEAIRTMTDLSERVSTRTTSSDGIIRGKSRRRPNQRETSKRDSSSRSDRSVSRSTSKSQSSRVTKVKEGPRRSSETRPEQPHNRRTKSGDHRARQASPRPSGRGASHSTEKLRRRQSTGTTSSDSTKLGEISHQGFSKPAIATYPLHGYRGEAVASKKGRWLGLFD